MKIPITIQTAHGLKFFDSVQSQWDFCHSNKLIEWYKSYLTKANKSLAQRTEKWLRVHVLDTKEEMHFWHTQLDKFATMKYFSEKSK